MHGRNQAERRARSADAGRPQLKRQGAVGGLVGNQRGSSLERGLGQAVRRGVGDHFVEGAVHLSAAEQIVTLGGEHVDTAPDPVGVSRGLTEANGQSGVEAVGDLVGEDPPNEVGQVLGALLGGGKSGPRLAVEPRGEELEEPDVSNRDVDRHGPSSFSQAESAAAGRSNQYSSSNGRTSVSTTRRHHAAVSSPLSSTRTDGVK